MVRVWAEVLRGLLGRAGRLAGQRCQLCAGPLEREHLLCAGCAAILAPRQGGYCPQCGSCFADPQAPPMVCLDCRRKPPPWSALAFHGPYAGALRDIIHEHKFTHDHGLGGLLRFLVVQAWIQHSLPRPERIVPVPMRPKAVVRRGFNQSAELSKMLGALVGVRPNMGLLRKIRDTGVQSRLDRATRQTNVRNAFAAGPELSGRHVLVVDDVMTTGATLAACVDACLRAKAARVDVFVLARAGALG